MDAVWRFAPADGSDLLLLLALADFCDDEGRCYPAVVTLAHKTRRTRRAVQYTLRRLEAARLVERDPKLGPHGVTAYRITLVKTIAELRKGVVSVA